MIDLTGQTFGDLRALASTDLRQKGNVVWACLCSCGGQAFVNANRLRFGVTKSCGCRKGRVTTIRNTDRTKHGHAKTGAPSSTYRVWRLMITRCENPRHSAFPYYGGRGIKVDLRWRTSFEVFLADMGERPEGLTLDRKDPNLDYGPENCRWATDAEQASNRRNTVRLTLNGETLTQAEWARRLGCKPSALRMRFVKGWSVERALTEPFEYRTPRKAVNPIPLAERNARSSFKHRYRHLSGDLTFDEWQVILARHAGCCAYCGSAENITMDHVVALSRGGRHTASNVVPACRSCNSAKKAK